MAAPASTVDPCSASLMNKMLRGAAGPGGGDRPTTFRASVSKKQSGTPAQRSIFCNKGMFIRNAAPAVTSGGQ
jgi:hypothetical protein